MPIQRKSGAPLEQINMVMPAAFGLNKQSETSILGPQWATTASNAVFDTSGRLAARQGWLNQTPSPIAGNPAITQIFELVLKNGTTQIISAGGGHLYLGVNAPTNITGTATTTAGDNWQFVNYFGKVYGFQQGAQPIVYDGATSFSNLVNAAGTAPQGNCACVHSGRIWAVGSDYQTIQYSTLLDATKWDSSPDNGGSIDMSSVWPGGTDQVIAMTFYNGNFFIFGKNRIVIWADPAGSVLGINPATMVVYDTIIGTGCIARDSVQQIEGGDILFLSSQGVESMSRLIVEKSNPLNGISRHIRDYLNTSVGASDKTKIRSVYSPEAAFYLLSMPDSLTAFCFSTTFPNQDGSLRVTEWDGFAPGAICRTLEGQLYATYPGVSGQIGVYSGYQDNSLPYTFDYRSGWMDAGEELSQYIKILKSITSLLWISSAADINLNWAFDFNPELFSYAASLSATGASEYNIAQYGIDQYSGGISLKDIVASAGGSGQFVQVGLSSTINGQALALQQFNLYTKIGRMAR